jgi:hypothetical protein
MQLWTTHNPARACFVSAAGYVVLWDFHSCEHLTAHLPLNRLATSFMVYPHTYRTGTVPQIIDWLAASSAVLYSMPSNNGKTHTFNFLNLA